ncbi:MAG: hypothetical protein N4A31_01385 [Rickettsiales bacterium]|nr:hypothetical protein [Rickettsiales bacterium]
MIYNKILKTIIILCGLLSLSSALLAQDELIVKAETGNCNKITVRDGGTPDTINDCNNSPDNAHNTSNIKDKVSSVKAEAIENLENNVPERNNR